MSQEMLVSLFGWMAVINGGLLVIATVAIATLGHPISHIHARLFGLAPDAAKAQWYPMLGAYKIAILVLNVVPWLVLSQIL